MPRNWVMKTLPLRKRTLEALEYLYAHSVKGTTWDGLVQHFLELTERDGGVVNVPKSKRMNLMDILHGDYEV